MADWSRKIWAHSRYRGCVLAVVLLFSVATFLLLTSERRLIEVTQFKIDETAEPQLSQTTDKLRQIKTDAFRQVEKVTYALINIEENLRCPQAASGNYSTWLLKQRHASGDTEEEQDHLKTEPRCGYFVTRNPSGVKRLGSQLSPYASFLGVWHKRAKAAGKVTFVQRPQVDDFAWLLEEAFDNLSLPIRNYSDQWYESRRFIVSDEPLGWGRYYSDPLLENMSCDGRNILMLGGRHSFKYFSDITEQIRQREFAFRQDVRRSAERMLDQTLLAAGRGRRRGGGDGCVLVGAHMRKGDITHKMYRDRGVLTADEEYLKEAILFHEKIHYRLINKRARVPCATFLVFGNDYNWNVNAVARIVPLVASSGTRIIVVDNKCSSPAADLCALSMCDHVIVSTGSFSWWAGYLSRGMVTFQADYAAPFSSHDAKITPQDYFPPHWIPL